MKNRKGLLPDQISFNLIIGIVIVLVALGVIIPLLMAQEGNTGCTGLLRYVGASVADTLGHSLCAMR